MPSMQVLMVSMQPMVVEKCRPIFAKRSGWITKKHKAARDSDEIIFVLLRSVHLLAKILP